MEGTLERPDGKIGDRLAVAVLDGVGALMAGPGQAAVRLEAQAALDLSPA